MATLEQIAKEYGMAIISKRKTRIGLKSGGEYK